MAGGAWARPEWWAVLGGHRSLRKEVSQERGGLGDSEVKGRELVGDEQRRKKTDNPGGRQLNLLAESSSNRTAQWTLCNHQHHNLLGMRPRNLKTEVVAGDSYHQEKVGTLGFRC